MHNLHAEYKICIVCILSIVCMFYTHYSCCIHGTHAMYTHACYIHTMHAENTVPILITHKFKYSYIQTHIFAYMHVYNIYVVIYNIYIGIHIHIHVLYCVIVCSLVIVCSYVQYAQCIFVCYMFVCCMHPMDVTTIKHRHTRPQMDQTTAPAKRRRKNVRSTKIKFKATKVMGSTKIKFQASANRANVPTRRQPTRSATVANAYKEGGVTLTHGKGVAQRGTPRLGDDYQVNATMAQRIKPPTVLEVTAMGGPDKYVCQAECARMCSAFHWKGRMQYRMLHLEDVDTSDSDWNEEDDARRSSSYVQLRWASTMKAWERQKKVEWADWRRLKKKMSDNARQTAWATLKQSPKRGDSPDRWMMHD